MALISIVLLKRCFVAKCCAYFTIEELRAFFGMEDREV